MAYTFREAFLLALKKTGRSAREVAEASGLKYERVKSLKQGKSKSPQTDAAAKIAAAFGVTLADFLEGRVSEGAPPGASFAEEAELLRAWRSASEEDREKVVAFLGFLEAQRTEREEPGD